ncbi:hypothetical protein Pcinc_006173 [Petrolisthes cinctipes]|uniref:Uncharacterized protein n=1 Tax=Petrolisthes cinctipes TaxID=88211 RepID=A0AAE1FWF4_PETCI|nr:hypothetical protein Pcinc_013672 [Petrolisthes cinctipes]KAK3885546.1 hypothetical protein Pcinc_010287 [Petrolisthes cinctipes]KAK3889847.1 hypothetical protein Pcinc_006173 [Petrolisthes cinctipes]
MSSSFPINPYTEVAVGGQHFQLLERFTVILYDKTSALEHVDEARKELFCQKGKTMEALPPPMMHCCSIESELLIRVEYGAPVSKANNMPSPGGWGWTLGEDSLSWVSV